jgi:predicted nucleotidyltransferase
MIPHGSQNIDQVVSRVLSRYPQSQKIILFGSRARGDSRNGSDIDLCLLFDKLPERPLVLLQNLYEDLFSFPGPAVDFVVYQNDDFQREAEEPGSFEQAIQQEGIAIYG